MEIKVGTVEKQMDVAAGTEFINVPWQIVEGEELLLEGVQGFPLETSGDEIKDFLNRKIVTFKENLALSAGAAALHKAQENAEKVVGDITGISISE